MIGLLKRGGSIGINIAIKLVIGTALFLAWLYVAGCCTYQGKAVSKTEAARMKALGMDVQCP